MGLLSTAEFAEIRAEIQTVTDTFMVTPVSYDLAIEKLSDFNEGNRKSYINYSLSGMAEWKLIKAGETTGKEVVWVSSGVQDKSTIRITCNLEDVVLAGLYDDVTYTTKMRPENDYMTVNGIKYKVKDVSLDGALERKNVLMLITGTQLIRNS